MRGEGPASELLRVRLATLFRLNVQGEASEVLLRSCG